MTTDDPHDEQAKIAVIVLAAGLGTRMRSRTPKELQPLLGRTMLDYVLSAAEIPQILQRIVVLSPTKSQIAHQCQGRFNVAWQDEQLGTGHAAASALSALDEDVTHVAVLFGDHPLLQREAVASLVEMSVESGALVTLLTAVLDDPAAYGRVRRDSGRITRIVEARDDRSIYSGPVEIYSGISCYERRWFEQALPHVPRSENGEYYLTSLVELAAGDRSMSMPVVAVQADPSVAYGVNDRIDLARAEQILRERILERHMRSGVTIVDPASTFVDESVKIGIDSRIEPFTILKGQTVIGENCVIGPQSVIESSRTGDDCQVVASHVEFAHLGSAVHVGPFAHLRAGTSISDAVHIGNYVEIKNSSLGRGTRVGHFSYLGDTEVGEDTNIGAGTVTCNYDGVDKHRTTIGSRVFVGSDTMLIAPVTLGDGAKTGAGSVVTRDLGPGELAFGSPARVRQKSDGRVDRNNIEGTGD